MVTPAWFDLGFRAVVDLSALAVVVALGCIARDYWLRSTESDEPEDVPAEPEDDPEPCDACPLADPAPELVAPVTWEGGW